VQVEGDAARGAVEAREARGGPRRHCCRRRQRGRGPCFEASGVPRQRAGLPVEGPRGAATAARDAPRGARWVARGGSSSGGCSGKRRQDSGAGGRKRAGTSQALEYGPRGPSHTRRHTPAPHTHTLHTRACRFGEMRCARRPSWRARSAKGSPGSWPGGDRGALIYGHAERLPVRVDAPARPPRASRTSTSCTEEQQLPRGGQAGHARADDDDTLAAASGRRAGGGGCC